MGLGRFGGGLGVTKWLLKQGAEVLVTDVAQESALSLQIAELGTHARLQFALGEHRVEDFTNTDVVVVNPAVPTPWNNKFLQAAWEVGVIVTTEIELVVKRLERKNVIGVTGTSGKSTTASMIHAALCSAGKRCRLGGNIGGSLLGDLSTLQKDELVVLELSSAMLWWLDRNGGWSPRIAVLTTVEPNHIDWHGSFEAYKKCKELLFVHQTEGDTALTQDSDSSFEGLAVLGKHNERNAAVALLAVVAAGAELNLARVGIQQFCGLPHRLQLVHHRCYNDSKSTTPSATKLAVDSFDDPSKVHLIVGGYDKKVDLRVLANQSKRVARMYAIGATQKAIAALATSDVDCFDSLESAVTTAKQNMEDGDVLLLSPGCASWDQFENYEQRGNLFCELVREVLPTQQVR